MLQRRVPDLDKEANMMRKKKSMAMSMQTKSCLSLCLIVLQTLYNPHVFAMEEGSQATFPPFGFQTGTSSDEIRSSYAVSMAYDDYRRELTIAGGTYESYFQPGDEPKSTQSGSDCFVAILHLPHKGPSMTSRTSERSKRVSWLRRRKFGNGSVSEFCSGIQVGKNGNIVSIGHSERGGLLDPLRPHGSRKQSVYGMVLDLNAAVELSGGKLLHSNEVQYPVSLTVYPDDQSLFVADVFTEDPHGALPTNVPTLDGENLSPIGFRLPFQGEGYSIRVTKFSHLINKAEPNPRGDVATARNHLWSREYGTHGLRNILASATSVISSSQLVVVGYTDGDGPFVGSTTNPANPTLDGFITVLDPHDGSIIQSKRIESLQRNGNDRVLGLCHMESSGNSSEAFLVGATDGIIDSTYLFTNRNSSTTSQNDAFLIKINVATMEILWKRQIGGAFPKGYENVTNAGSQVHGLACAVTPDGEDVYMAGNVEGGAVLSIPNYKQMDSSGSGDIFVTKFDANDGTLTYAHQLGSDDDDSLAEGNSLETDSHGNLILLGNTRGSMFRPRATMGKSDLFVMSFSRDDGSFLPVSQSSDEGSNRNAGDHTSNEGGGIEVPWSRYDNALLAFGLLLGIALVVCGIALIVRERKVKLMEKPHADSGTASVADSSSGGWREGVTTAGDGTRRTWRSSMEASSIRSDAEISDITERTGLYHHRNNKTRVLDDKGHRRSSSRQHEMETAYGDIYDLLSEASRRLSHDASGGSPSPSNRSIQVGSENA